MPFPRIHVRTHIQPALEIFLLALGLVAGAFLGACSEAPKKQTNVIPVVRPVGAAIRFEDASVVLEKSCISGCHSPGGVRAGVPLTDLRAVRTVRKDVYERLTSTDPAKVMPPSDMKFRNTPDGKFLLEWIRLGTDVMTEHKLGGPSGTSPGPGGGGGASPGLGVPKVNPEDFTYTAFLDVQPDLQESCGGCHGEGGEAYSNFPLVNESDWLDLRNRSIASLTGGTMPKGTAGSKDNLTWLNTPVGKKIFGWLKHGSEFQGGETGN
jgi:hypothetical protein